jgi:vitamin B12 transporter
MILCAENVLATDIGRIVVTANRTAQVDAESLASFTVITREDIQRLQPHSLQDLLRGVTGLTLSNSGGPGKATSMFLRGTESDHTLVMLNGIKLGSATLGMPSIQDLPPDQIERIEIVRGPRSSLYGSEAIGGVIQIFTRRGGDEFKRHFSIDIGSHATRGGALGLSGGGEDSWYSIDLALSDTDGFDACRANSDGGCFTDEPDDDGYRNESASLRLGHRFANGFDVDFHALRTEGENEYDGNFFNESKSRQQVLGVSLRGAPVDLWLLTLKGGKAWDESDNYKDGRYQTTFNTERETFLLQNDLELGEEQLITLGFDYQVERVDSSYEYEVDNRDNLGYFIQYQGDISAHQLQLSVRQDDHESFARHTTGGIGWGYAFEKGIRLWASYATAFKAPTFNELYYPGFGNSALQPEESSSLELALQGRSEWGAWSLSTYQTQVDELIGFDASNSPVNIDRARIRGIEARIDTAIGSWQTQASLTLLDPRNASGASNDDNLLPRRTQQTLRIDLDRRFGAYSLGASFFAEGERYDDLANTRRLGGFATLDLRAGYRINNTWRLQGRCENLFDKVYETASYYNQPERSFYLTLSYQS